MVNAIYLKELEVNHLYMEIKEKVMKHDNLQLLLLLLIVMGMSTSTTKDAEMGGKLQLPTSTACILTKYYGVIVVHVFLFRSL